jgi:hypothetical protein
MEAGVNGRLAFNLLLLAAAGYFVWSAFEYEGTARHIPLLIGSMVLVLQGWVTFRSATTPEPALVEDGPDGPPPADEAKRVAAASGWMLLYLALFATVGTLAATFLFILAFLLAQRDVRWWVGLAVAAGTSGAIWVLFGRLMRFELYPGILFGGTLPPI